MPTFRITIVNDKFESSVDVDHGDFDTAAAQAQRGALEIAVEQIVGGKLFFGAEVIVAEGNRRERFIVSVGVGALK